MANFVLGNSLDFHEILGTQEEKEDVSWASEDKRHYKKDSRCYNFYKYRAGTR